MNFVIAGRNIRSRHVAEAVLIAQFLCNRRINLVDGLILGDLKQAAAGRIVLTRWQRLEDKRIEEQQNSRSQKGATDHEESEKSDGMNPMEADRFDAQSYDQQYAGKPERRGNFKSTGVHS